MTTPTPPTTPEDMIRIKGIPVSGGLEIGRAFVLLPEGIHLPLSKIDPSQADAELKRLDEAWDQTVSQIEESRSPGQSERQLVDELIDMHIMLANDMPQHTGPRVEQLVREEGFHIETAFHQALQELLQRLSLSQIQRSEDVEGIGHQVLHNLAGLSPKQFEDITEPVVLIADDLTPSMTARLPREKVLAFATQRGNRTSHTAIMARALGIPAVVSLPGLLDHVTDGELVVLDGSHGHVVIRPTEESLEKYKHGQKLYRERQEVLHQLIHYPAETRDGFKFSLMANIEMPEEVEAVIENGGNGIGLYRTEFLFMNRPDLPSEEEQFWAYRTVAESLAPNQVVIRTLDIGGDKTVESLSLPKEENPFMGCRAIRLCLQNPELFQTQLRAILRASNYGQLGLMFPMITDVRELRQAAEAVDEAKASLRHDGIEFDENIEVGAMVEVPSAALMVPSLANYVDFFSIGTNDLIQYTLAADRTNERTAYLYNPLHPSVLHLIKQVVVEAHRRGKRVCMCGEMAGQPELVLVLMGLMLDELSMSPLAIPEIKRCIRSVSLEQVVPITEQCLKMSDPVDIQKFVHKQVHRLLPWLIDGDHD